MDEPIAYKNEHGIWIYRRLPENMRIATRNDFYLENDELIIGKYFLAQSLHYLRYEAHRTNKNFNEKWSFWLVHSHLFIRCR